MATECDIGLLLGNDELNQRCKSLASQFNYNLLEWTDIDQYMEDEPVCKVVIGSAVGNRFEENPAELAQMLRQIGKDCFIVCIISKTLKKEVAAFIKRSGANLLMLESEILNTSKLEFVCTQVLKSNYFPIKSTDLVAGAELLFDLYHLMPQRAKFLKFAFSGDPVTKEKIKKISDDVGEIYILRTATAQFNEYTRINASGANAGLAARCRSQFLLLCSKYVDLVINLTDQSEIASYTQGQELLSQCKKICSDLNSCLSAYGNAWEIINKSGIGDFGSIERATAVSAYTALFGMYMDLEEIDKLMLTALLADLGLLLLPPSITGKIRDDKLEELTEEELSKYHDYPAQSLKVVLERKLSIEEPMRKALLAKHEQNDGSGFPKGKRGDVIPLEAQLIHFSDEFDKRTLLKFGKKRVGAEEAKTELIQKEIQAELEKKNRYNSNFIERLRTQILVQEKN